MNIHEYQAKALLADYDVPVPAGKPAFTVEEAALAARDLQAPWVVKAQIHAGGRGKGGGVKVTRSLEEVRAEAERMLGMTLVTHQTGLGGKVVNRLYIEQGAAIARELYLSLLVDRASGRLAFIASTEGGMDIEEVAAKTPEKIITVPVDPATGISGFHGRRIAFALGLEGEGVKQAVTLVDKLYRAFMACDMSLLEINPLVVTEDGSLVCLDAKVSLEDNALYRHPALAALRDESEEDPAETEASRHGLSYVKLDGEVGCMVNGAGLAMATMDIIKLYGSSPANFLDVGGGATREKVTQAFRIILSDETVRGILVNIFGGIMRCDVIAEGVVAAAREVSLTVPLVVRLAGTNVEQGEKILMDSGLPVITAKDLGDAAEKITAAMDKANERGARYGGAG